MNKDIIVYSLILILIILIIYLFIGFRQLSSTVSDNDPQSPTSSIPQNIDLSNYYTKSDIDSSFSTKSYVDTNIQNSVSNIRVNQDGNIFRYAGTQELGYDIEIDNTIRFNHPVDFNDNISINYENTLINTLPPGSIIAWNSVTIPKGWALCDGQLYILDSNGDAQVESTGVQTPDLRGRFILGAGQGSLLTNRTLGDTNGAETHTLNVNEMPAHNHSYSGTDWPASGDYGSKAEQNQTGSPHDYTRFNVSKTTVSKGGNSAHNNMPPFYVLTYIMKI
jgi:microcystin-dependent protein